MRLEMEFQRVPKRQMFVLVFPGPSHYGWAVRFTNTMKIRGMLLNLRRFCNLLTGAKSLSFAELIRYLQ